MATVPSAPAVASKRCVSVDAMHRLVILCVVQPQALGATAVAQVEAPDISIMASSHQTMAPGGAMQTDVTAAAWSPLSAPTNLPDAKSISRAQPSTWPVATSCMILWQHTEVTAGCLAVAPSGRPAEPAASCPSAPRLLPTAGPQPGGKDPP
eukprot:CAMPEP_0179113426 /NCGR_PEP_ID=MMETSP0796-20121207/53067_1 /TAXON_ID=73915 /ORGANISM="Pyrodinium bahamense, Strain pbaha01" /LENGTH=151 /DNA_ID=CAMNT_0020811623 /DNA_START=60 /DNA_END=513 /DNA_ORIENTATION=-